MSNPKVTREQAEAAKDAVPVHHPATSQYRESWSVTNPRGVAIHYGSREEAESVARTGVY